MLEANSRSILNKSAWNPSNKALNEAGVNYVKSDVNGLEAVIEATYIYERPRDGSSRHPFGCDDF
jgi:hypothetical protein